MTAGGGPRPSSPLLPERRRSHFGHYRPLAVLGRGGMATVYLAASHGPSNFVKLVVAKELHPELSDDPDFRTMFLDEARLAARLHHPNIVHTFEVLEEGPQLVLVMEYLDGQTFSRVRQRANTRDPMARWAMLRMLADALAGLHYAHELADYDGSPLGVVHRDVSPQNIFVTYAGETKVVDFGVAKVAGASSRTASGVVKGKLTYMAPEQAVGHPVDRRADVFAAGVMLWEVVAGVRMWTGIEDGILGRLNVGNIPALREAAPHVPEALARIVDRAVAARPEHRFSTAAALQSALEDYLASQRVAMSSRQTGALVSELFAKERDEMRTLIEEQLRGLLSPVPPDRSLPQLDERGQSGTGSSGLMPGQVVTTTEAWKKSTSLSKRVGPSEAPPAPPQKRRVGMAIGLGVAGAVALCGLALGSALLRRAPVVAKPAPLAAAPSAPLASTAPPASVPAVAPATARLRVSAKPQKAALFLDETPLAGNPAEIPVVVDRQSHVVTASAPGYATQTESLVFDGDRTVTLSLEPSARPRAHAKPQAGDPDLGF